ncbi:unnamed protein product [Trifolium pratense]|uniref:Uncharacterized protein n=1 Tax=Trifolium pratense TaxID=57577 RepID=A0ACB0IVZ2_TRIPR|nr:unnamed protein product [Trifolium pratense]
MEKDIFLDIFCFFIGKDRGYVTEILNGGGLHAVIGIVILIERSLVKIEKNNKLGMHDLPTTWVHWQEFAYNYIPDDFYLGNIVVIDLKHSNIEQVWNESKLLWNLKILNLSHSKYLKSTPDFSKSPNLEKLIMKDCPKLSEVHQSIGDLNHLLLINLKDCTSLNNLPKKIYKLKSLKTLILSGCSKIDRLEEDIVQMESLTTLIAKDTAIKEVPYSIIRSKSIGFISLCGYEGLSRDIFPSLI